jgi:hypothetical protein
MSSSTSLSFNTFERKPAVSQIDDGGESDGSLGGLMAEWEQVGVAAPRALSQHHCIIALCCRWKLQRSGCPRLQAARFGIRAVCVLLLGFV